MRTAEILNTLSQAQGGVKVTIERSKARVSTNYANLPHVSAEGDSIFKAAFKCAKDVLETVKKYPSFRQFCPDVLKALEAYDDHSNMLSL